MERDAFSLVKWYLDCVTEDGEAAILYGTEFRWRGVRISASSVLTGAAGAVHTRSSLAALKTTETGGRIEAEIPKHQVSGTWSGSWIGSCSGSWSGGGAACEQTVYEAEAGRVHWQCLMPRARVELRVGERRIEGLGYAERLRVTVAPWKLPLRRLVWGRFVSESDSLVWVDWQGTYSTRFAFLNGVALGLDAAGSDEVLADGVRLKIGAGHTLRSGRVGATILPDLPALARLLPAAVAGIEEQKWCCPGELIAPDRRSSGWVIHEVVEWNG